jgi:endogenous inhibitor of DNA gyrase (YacG/DUF329 family)
MSPTSNPPAHASPARTVPCPTCGGDSVYAPSNPYRPFCSERCKKRDLGAWASESFRVPSSAPPEDEAFGDPKLQ